SRLAAARADGGTTRESAELWLEGQPYWLAHHVLNSGQGYPPVHEVRLTSLAGLRARQSAVSWQITAAGVFLVLAGLAVSGVLSARFSGWFGRFARDSEAQRALRAEAETRLDRTAAELERAARFAADASHQLKTPVAVVRLGLEELAAGPAFPAEQRGEVDELVRQTDRLAHILETLLLLAKLDAGLIRASDARVDLGGLAAAALDDLSALPAVETITLEHSLPETLFARGDARQIALVLQNLLENAAKYNRPGGRVRVSAEFASSVVRLLVANTAPNPVPAEAAERIFERFHRGSAAGDVPGYGLGLNLARHLARLQGGEVRLVSSDAGWTVFALELPRA
ncbi:MAG: HAMP domain-containing histidine kinase, partial [Burkholderiales bacterium]|nr:HAMP domain-containing histidine kinase [Opitutaceae bacterium]